jgi:hypothetical protein
VHERGETPVCRGYECSLCKFYKGATHSFHTLRVV